MYKGFCGYIKHLDNKYANIMIDCDFKLIKIPIENVMLLNI